MSERQGATDSAAGREPDPEESAVAKSHLGFPVVGIGASAGGIGALRRFFETLPGGSGMAYVVIMHLSPDHESSLCDILQRSAKIPVSTVEQWAAIEADHVYVISPSQKLVMSDGGLSASEMRTLEGRRSSIDLFFRSLAQAHRERAVCVVLSGTGSDGSEGLKRIKEMGGVAFAQSAEDAEFDSMPSSAIRTGLIDFAMPVAEMPAKLLALWQNASRLELPKPPADLDVKAAAGEDAASAEEALLSIKALLRERTGHDFAHYKRGTILRRLERRMQVTAVPDLPSYRRVLDNDPKETPALLQDMLISVTNFFRDPDAFDALSAALHVAAANRPARAPFRAWVAGCATGEEAYSVAMTLREVIPDGTQIQVFASDIDRRAVASARAGVYPASISTDVSPERLRRFFAQEAGGGYRIDKGLRDTVVFSAHNVLSDPPFTRMDLVCCRNLLIYLDRIGQAQLLRSFHFALRPGGLMFLGGSETADAVPRLFGAVDKARRVYRAGPAPARPSSLPPVQQRSFDGPAMLGAAVVDDRPAAERPPLEVLHERAARSCAAPTVLVDADDTVLHVSDRAGHLLRVAGGAPSNKLMALARPELRAELRAAIARAAAIGRAVEARRVRLTINGEQCIVAITAHPVMDQSAGLMLVSFEQFAETMAPEQQAADGRDPLVEALEAELEKTRVLLRSAVGESAASTEELRAFNEELQTINEELRSTTEELETSREELQSVNEELTTVNTELSLKAEESERMNDDLHNLMVSADIGTVFVDRDMRVRRFTPQAATLLNLLPSDEGRPLAHIRHRLEYPDLEADAMIAMRDLRRSEREVRSEDGRWFLVRSMPYRSGADRIEGAALAFVDVSARREADEKIRHFEKRLRLVAGSMRDYAIVTTDERGVIDSWSEGARRIFGYEPSEAVGQPFAILFPAEDRSAGTPEAELKEAREHGRAADDRWLVRKGGQRIYCSGIVTPLMEGGLVGNAKIARDFTSGELRQKERDAALLEEQVARRRLEEASDMKDEFLAVMSHELKNPLAVIHMNAQLLARLPAFQGEPAARKIASTIERSVTSQAQIIDDLLELSRLNTGKVKLEPERLDLAELMRTIGQAAQRDAAAKRQELSIYLPDPLWIDADPVRVEQIVWNLVSNAVKFTPDGGRVSVRLSVESAMAKVSVSDSGIGIDADDIGHVFDMFRQAERGPSRRKTGLGIGLALVKQLTELHGGRVEARSKGLGQGAEFAAWLPLSEDAVVKARSLPAPSKGFAGKRILLVDDEPELLSVFAQLLTAEGASVAVAGSASQALELARTGAFHAVVSDIAMPGHDGHWLARELRADARTAGLPMVAVSGMARDADKAQAFEAGFDAHVGKPLALDALGEALADAAARRAKS